VRWSKCHRCQPTIGQSVVEGWGYVQSSAKWSEVFAKRLEEVHRHALVIGVKGRCLETICDIDRVGETMWNDRDDSRR
jgi:hypothetical protein